MEVLRVYFLENIFLLCLTFGVIFMVLQSHNTRKNAMLMPIFIVSTAVLLSIIRTVEDWANKIPELSYLATVCAFLGFALRPLVIYFFIRLTVGDKPIILKIAIGMLILNALIYATSLLKFWDPVYKAAFYYDEDMVFQWGPLYFATYFISGIMVAYIIYTSLVSLQGRHRGNAIASLICVVFIGIAVLLETLNDQVKTLLNTMIAISCLFYVVHLYQQAGRRDALTGLYDRRTYYGDCAKFGNLIHSILLVDMNGLKAINDNEGHEAGDEALITIASIIDACADKKLMYVYRMGGDEFTIIDISQSKESIIVLENVIQEKLAETRYTVSTGYAFREGTEETIRDMTSRAEQMMYERKAAYYKATGKERRKA